jgi:lipid-A-disaccharide synthase
MRVFISAGEASGDALGAALISALKAADPELVAFGMGGPRMAALGFEVKKDSKELNVNGLVEVLRHLPRLFRLKDEVAAIAIDGKPDVAVLIDVPDFNVRVAKKLKAAGIKVAFYVAPTVWAWRPGRVKKYAPVIDRLMVLFPFELPLWQKAGVDVTCVGHPLLDEIPTASPAALIRRKTIALLPGSRPGEIHRHFSIMLGAAKRLLGESVADRFVVPVAPTLDSAWLRSLIAAAGLGSEVELVEDRDGALRRAAIAESELALVVSGTATLETALIGRPQVLFYRLTKLSHVLTRLLMKIPDFGLPNIILGRRAVPELEQEQMSVEALVAESKRLLADRDAQASINREIRDRLGPPGAADRAAEVVINLARA